MEFLKVEGCVNYFLGVDGEREIDMTEEERQKSFEKAVEFMKKDEPDTWFNSFLQWFCETYGEFDKSDKPCEACGDYTYTWKVVDD